MKWHFWIDRGGTFTDVVARTPAGTIVTAKLLSHDPEHYEDAAVEAVRRLMGVLVLGEVPGETVGDLYGIGDLWRHVTRVHILGEHVRHQDNVNSHAELACQFRA